MRSAITLCSSIHRHTLAFRMPLRKQRHCKEGEGERQRKKHGGLKNRSCLYNIPTHHPLQLYNKSNQNPMSQFPHKPTNHKQFMDIVPAPHGFWNAGGGLRSKQGFAQSFACERYAVMLVAKVLGPYLSSHPLNFRASYSRSNRAFV